jgi:hypothetical protein
MRHRFPRPGATREAQDTPYFVRAVVYSKAESLILIWKARRRPHPARHAIRVPRRGRATKGEHAAVMRVVQEVRELLCRFGLTDDDAANGLVVKRLVALVPKRPQAIDQETNGEDEIEGEHELQMWAASVGGFVRHIRRALPGLPSRRRGLVFRPAGRRDRHCSFLPCLVRVHLATGLGQSLTRPRFGGALVLPEADPVTQPLPRAVSTGIRDSVFEPRPPPVPLAAVAPGACLAQVALWDVRSCYLLPLRCPDGLEGEER